MDLSCYTLAIILEVTTLEDDVPSTCPPTPSPSVVHSLKAFPIIHEDHPLEAIEAEVELGSFAEKLNKVLTFDRGVLEEGEITIVPVDP